MSHSMNTYSRIPVAFTRGERVWVWDESGKKYLDALAGIAVNTLGHGHPKLTRAIAEQSSRLIHASNLYRIAEQERLADKLAAISGMENAFFCNSGCEANEAAIKLARLYGHGKGVESPGIVVMDKAFHGRTLATLSATGNRKVQQGFEPLVPGFVRVPFNDIDSVRQVAPGRGRNQYFHDGIPARSARALRPPGLVSHGGRSPVRPGPHGQMVRLSAR